MAVKSKQNQRLFATELTASTEIIQFNFVCRIGLLGVGYGEKVKKLREQLAPCVKKLHEVTEKICVAKIGSFI